jgi:hypothetical protein
VASLLNQIFNDMDKTLQKMGLIDEPDVWMQRLGLALKIEGVLFSMFWMMAYTLKFGMVWHDAGPPFGPTKYSCYFNMILAVYAVLGLYLFKIGKNPAQHKSLIGFLIWSSMAHLIVLVLCVLLDDTPSWSGQFMGVHLPERVYGIAHWQNVSPVGDVPLLLLFTFGDMYLAKKAFGTYLLPTDV